MATTARAQRTNSYIGAGIIGVKLPKWRAAKAAVLAGARNARLLADGDSTVWGYGAAGATFGGNLRAGSWPTKLAGLIASGSAESWIGNGDTAGTNRYTGSGGADTRINAGSWGLGGGSKIGLGQYPYVATAAGTPFAFTPVRQFDTIEILYLTDPTNGVGSFAFDVLIDGNVMGRVDGNQAEGIRKATFTVALGNHTVACNWVSGNCYLSGMVATRSDAKEASVINAGAAGAKIADRVSPSSAARAYSPLASMGLILPDAIVLSMTINDANSATALATYSAGIQTYLDRGKAVGADVLGVTGAPGDPAQGRASYAQQQSYVDAFKAVFAANGFPVVDIFADFGNWTAANARGLMNDPVHPNAAGYTYIAGKVADVLNAA